MMRAAILALLLSASAVSAQAPEYVVKPTAAPCLKIRPAPSADSTQFDCLAVGARVQWLDAVPYWHKVRLGDGRTGWMAKKFLELSPPAAATDTAIPEDAWLEVHFVDVGTGDGIWIATHDDGIAGNERFEGRNVVIDGGPDTTAMRAYLLAHAHEGAIVDALVLTHAHTDHYRGAQGVVRHFDVHDYYDPGYAGAADYKKFRKEVDKEGIDGNRTHVMVGQRNFEKFDLGQEVKLEVLYSDPGSTATGLGSNSDRVNNSSTVLRLTYGQHTFLFMGDAEGKTRADTPHKLRYVEKRLLEAQPPVNLKATVLKLGHHGSETSSTDSLIAAVDPQYVIVQSGRQKYGTKFLPDSSVLRRFCDHNPNIRIYRTDRDDAAQHRTGSNDADGDDVVVRTNGKTLLVTQLADGREVPVSTCSVE